MMSRNVDTASIAEAQLLDTTIRLAKRLVAMKQSVHAALLGEGVASCKPSSDVCGLTDR